MNVVATPKFLHLLLKQGYQNQRNLILLVILLAMVASIGTKVLLFYWQLTENPSNSDGSINTTVTKSGSDIKYEDFELIFGFSEQQASQVTNQRDIPTTRLSLTLRGIIANPENSEYDSAIIQSANQDKLYFLGDALPGGAILNRVYADYVVIKRGSQLEKLYFPDAARDSRTLQEFRPAVEEPVVESHSGSRSSSENHSDDMSLEERMQEIREKLQETGQE